MGPTARMGPIEPAARVYQDLVDHCNEIRLITGGTTARRTCNPAERQLGIQLERDRKLETGEINGGLGANASRLKGD